MKFLFLASIIAAAFAINGPAEMATVERCDGTARQCLKFLADHVEDAPQTRGAKLKGPSETGPFFHGTAQTV